jgi:hypothetical protein
MSWRSRRARAWRYRQRENNGLERCRGHGPDRAGKVHRIGISLSEALKLSASAERAISGA